MLGVHVRVRTVMGHTAVKLSNSTDVLLCQIAEYGLFQQYLACAKQDIRCVSVHLVSAIHFK